MEHSSDTVSVPPEKLCLFTPQGYNVNILKDYIL